MTERLADFFIFFPVFLFSLSFHEASHAWMANRLGDPTAKMLGRLTLNPLAHIDWIGTVLFPLMMFLMPGLLLFGWAKPVPVTSRNLRGGRKGDMWVSAAGPISNVMLALVFAGILHVMSRLSLQGEMTEHFIQIFATGVYLNLMLAIFNLVPIHPLDGSHIFAGFLPRSFLPMLESINRYGFLIMIAGLYLGFFKYLTIPVSIIADFLLPR
ncbi:MAG: site-2 protease family protein [Deltaproteobacteria bacterium]|nr:MAG: site-2 protease family protein [Deltaproteobacteria bacterium]